MCDSYALHCDMYEQYAGDKWEKDGKWELPGQLRFKMWLGLEKDEAEWHKSQTDAELAVFAETVCYLLSTCTQVVTLCGYKIFNDD